MVVFEPCESRLLASKRCAQQVTDDRETVLAVHKQNDADLLTRIGYDEAFEAAIIAPVPQGFSVFRFLNSDAQAPEDTFRKLLRSTIRTVGAFGIDGNLGTFHFFERCLAQADVVQQSFDEQRIVARRRVQAGGRVRVLGLEYLAGYAGPVVRHSGEGIKVGPPDVTAALHGERNEHGFGHVVVQRLARDLLDDLRQIDETFTGIAEAFAGREMNGERLAIWPPVGEASSMAQDNSRGDFVETRVALDVRVGKIFGERRVEVELALVHEFENAVGEYGFAERGSFEDGVFGYRLAGFCISQAEGMQPVAFAVTNQGHREAGHGAVLQQFGDLFLQRCDGGGVGFLQRGRFCDGGNVGV
jgi:hypothetical protein